ncbi:hypothetical protein M0811_10593 [Anaeramoeba ignava]|uniref:Transmembrane protein n=1 Tax=Anaeramoeba ignava TaxID=1746090 RepID=A0A9Q0R8J6_ANAIG|nr:hypothetical protein M0811_10593 [Anaeramoeba ignava]
MTNCCPNSKKRISKLIGNSTVLDFVGDDVVWRVITVFFLSTFFIFTFGVGIRYLFEGTKINEDQIGINLDFFKFPNQTQLYYGESFTAELRVSRKFKSKAIKNCQVTVSASSLDSIQNQDQNQDLSLIQMRDNLINQIQMAGDLTQFSDENGFVKFSNLSIFTGSSQTINLTFFAQCGSHSDWKGLGPSSNFSFQPNNQSDQISFPLYLKSKIHSFYLLNYFSINETINYEEEIDFQFYVSINPNVPEYLKNLSISLVPENSSWNYPEYESYLDYDVISQYQDENEIYHLKLIFFGSTSTKMNITFFCEGFQISGLVYNNNEYLITSYPLNFNSKVSKIEIQENRSLSVKEGEIFAKPWIISVKDNNSNPIGNKTVFAKISKQCNNSISENQSPIDYSKVLLNSIVKTNGNGIANFSNLKFSVSGFTNQYCSFQIKFISDGIFNETENIQVNSSVSQIIWIEHMNHVYTGTTLLNLLIIGFVGSDEWPVIKVQDEKGKGIPNKLVTFTCSNFSARPYQFVTDQNGFASLYMNIPWSAPKKIQLNNILLLLMIFNQNLKKPI